MSYAKARPEGLHTSSCNLVTSKYLLASHRKIYTTILRPLPLLLHLQTHRIRPHRLHRVTDHPTFHVIARSAEAESSEKKSTTRPKTSRAKKSLEAEANGELNVVSSDSGSDCFDVPMRE